MNERTTLPGYRVLSKSGVALFESYDEASDAVHTQRPAILQRRTVCNWQTLVKNLHTLTAADNFVALAPNRSLTLRDRKQ